MYTHLVQDGIVIDVMLFITWLFSNGLCLLFTALQCFFSFHAFLMFEKLYFKDN